MSLRTDRTLRAPKKTDRDMIWLQWEEETYSSAGRRLMNISFALLLFSSIAFPLGLGLVLLYAR